MYGTALHLDNGTKLDGGYTVDNLWELYWWEIAILLSQRYGVPAGRVSRIFVDALVEELEGTKESRWNAEMFIVFQVVILQ